MRRKLRLLTASLRRPRLAEEELLRRPAISDEAALFSAVLWKSGLLGLDDKTSALTRLAALVAVESAVTSYQWAIDEAIAQGRDRAGGHRCSPGDRAGRGDG
jgi:hypothetical protein